MIIKRNLLIRETQGVIRQLGNLMKKCTDQTELRCLEHNLKRQRGIEKLLLRISDKEYKEIMNREVTKGQSKKQTLF